MPSNVKLSTSIDVIAFKSVIVPPRDVSVEPIVIPSFTSLAFAIEPASCAFDTPNALIVTSPDEVSKSALLNVAIPLLLSEASSPVIVISLSDTTVSIPVPPVNVIVSPVLTESFEPVSAAILNVLTTVPNDRLPEPSVLKNCPDVPSAVGCDKPSIITAPDPFGVIVISPFVSVDVMALPFNVKLSTLSISIFELASTTIADEAVSVPAVWSNISVKCCPPMTLATTSEPEVSPIKSLSELNE